jgi:hypothetical protein
MLYIFFRDADKRRRRIDQLPLAIFKAIQNYILTTPVGFLAKNLDHIYPHGVSAEELSSTLEYLYQIEPNRGSKKSSRFVHLLRTESLPREDEEFVHWLLDHLEHALKIKTLNMNVLVDNIQDAFDLLLKKNAPFSRNERTLIQLHLLAGFHNTLIDIDPSELSEKPKTRMKEREVFLTIGAMEEVLTLDLGIFFRNDKGELDCYELIEESEGVLPKFYQSIVWTDLNEEYFLEEKDVNIRTALYGFPVEVAWRRGIPKLVARKSRIRE